LAKFLVDADMPARTAQALRDNGYDAVDVRELGMGRASDELIFDRAQREGRAVVSKDLGFGSLASISPGHFGVVLLRFGGLRSPAIVRGLLADLDSLSAGTTNLSGMIAVLEPGRIRTRKLP
jgi:predicted nuclease of predicted toxin-antitoxin system